MYTSVTTDTKVISSTQRSIIHRRLRIAPRLTSDVISSTQCSIIHRRLRIAPRLTPDGISSTKRSIIHRRLRIAPRLTPDVISSTQRSTIHRRLRRALRLTRIHDAGTAGLKWVLPYLRVIPRISVTSITRRENKETKDKLLAAARLLYVRSLDRPQRHAT